MSKLISYFSPAVFVILCLNTLAAHDGPDPVLHWSLSSRAVSGATLAARLGPDAEIEGQLAASNVQDFQSLHFDGQSFAIAANDFRDLDQSLIPLEAITISTVISIEEGQDYGGIVGVIQDNGGSESGWVLGYDQKHFYFGLASKGSDDGDGLMTYLKGKSRFELGKLYHIVATYDGKTMQLFVNGQLDGQSTAQSGNILYPDHAPLVIGGYKDADEDTRHVGRIADVAIYGLAAKPEWASEEFSHYQAVTRLPASGIKPTELGFAVKPYLQFVTKTSITVMWETSKPTAGMVMHGENASVKNKIKSDRTGHIHEVTIEGLNPETQYFYQVGSTDDADKSLTSEVLTFQTANQTETPFSFAVIGDTQGNPSVSGKLAEHAWAYRPNFLMHAGDLVSTGTNDSHWLKHFFSSMHPLIGRVAMFPVLGNHEQNADNYYNYMSLPEPEYYYKFQYGNAEFFMLDTNKNVGPDSEQYKWLDEELSKSTAKWKIVCHHHPPYSSDENDYGNLWKTNKSTRGDTRVRKLTPLYDKHDVDIVWSGHVHSYERTWCLRGDRVVKEGKGALYMVTGGGGGGLETAGPFRPAFQNNVRHGHHYCIVAVNGGTLEFKAFDIENRLFDYFKMQK